MSNRSQIDPRGPQFNAALTSAVLLVVLLTTLITGPFALGVALLALQAVLFAWGAVLGVQSTPAAHLYKLLVRPRLQAPAYLEDARPPRFAQAVGLVFTVVGLVGYLSGVTLLGAIATGFALVAALLNAVLRLCLGCKLYGLCTITPPTSDETNKKEALI